MLKTCTVAKKGLDDVQLDNPHVRSTSQQKNLSYWNKRVINSKARYSCHLKRGGRKPSKVEIPYAPCKTNTYMPPVLVTPKEKENNLKASIQLLTPLFLPKFKIRSPEAGDLVSTQARDQKSQISADCKFRPPSPVHKQGNSEIHRFQSQEHLPRPLLWLLYEAISEEEYPWTNSNTKHI